MNGKRPRLGLALGRRQFLAASGLTIAAASLAACAPRDLAADPDFILASDPEVAATEAARAFSGRTVAQRLVAAAEVADASGRGTPTWAWGYTTDAGLAALGPTIRAGVGDRLVVDVDNVLAEQTSVHWHGLRIRNDMDGSPPTTQRPIEPGTAFRYDFLLPDPGTYWYHSHNGLQADRALFGALVVEDPDDATGADADVVVVLDDWLDGKATPEQVLAALGGGTGGHDHGASAAAPATTDSAAALVAHGAGDSSVLGGSSQHISYPAHLANGRPADDPDQLVVPPGGRVRLRIVNAAAETPYRVGLAEHELTVVAADGFDTEPYVADAVLLAPAQRVDVLVSVGSGAWPLVAKVEGRDAAALAVVRTSDSAAESPRGQFVDLPELRGRLASDAQLRPAEHTMLPSREPDREWRIELRQAGDRYAWAIAGEDAGRLHPRRGERVRITMENTSPMWHPMHLHGHTFAIVEHGGLRRDTAIVLPRSSLSIDFDADNPGQWMLHCHNAYHFEAGMTASLGYIR